MFDFMKRPDMEEGLARLAQTDGGVLLDVRTREEYVQGHIPGSVNLPLNEVVHAARLIPDQNTPVFVYCLTGARSAQAVKRLGRLGYASVSDLGGLNGYRGKVAVGA